MERQFFRLSCTFSNWNSSLKNKNLSTIYLTVLECCSLTMLWKKIINILQLTEELTFYTLYTNFVYFVTKRERRKTNATKIQSHRLVISKQTCNSLSWINLLEQEQSWIERQLDQFYPLPINKSMHDQEDGSERKRKCC